MTDISNFNITKVITVSWDTSADSKPHRWVIETEHIDGDDYFALDKLDSGLTRFISCDGTTTNG